MLARLRLRSTAVAAILTLTFWFGAEAFSSDPFRVGLPPGISEDLWSYFIPRSNLLTAEKVELGRMLFFDPRLSADGTVSCSTCHDRRFAFADGKALAVGIGGRLGTRNSPTLLNSMFNPGQFWDGRADSLESQAKLPLIDKDEMGNVSLAEVEARIASVEEYSRRFRAVFNGPPSADTIAKAIAAYERTLVSGDGPFDRFAAGETEAIGPEARRGLSIFRGKGRCAICHIANQSFPFFTDQNYRNTGVAANEPAFGSLFIRARDLARNGATRSELDSLAGLPGASSLGRFLITGNPVDIGAFRTPSLRNVELTAPYFHDGSAATLADVIEFYARGGRENPNRDWEMGPLDLDRSERSDLIEFLKSLTGRSAGALAGESVPTSR